MLLKIMMIFLLVSCSGVQQQKLVNMIGITKTIRPAISLQEIGPLKLQKVTKDRKLPHVSAASGMQIIDKNLYVVADDELFLASFPLDLSQQGKLFKLVPGKLPKDHVARKKGKPDWESMALLPKNSFLPEGGLLLLSSGSGPKRQKAVISVLEADGPSSRSISIDMSEIYQEIGKEIKELNIEGVIVVKNELKFFHRGNGQLKENAVISINLDSFMNFVENQKLGPSIKIINSIRFYRSEIKGGPIATFSDGASLSDGRILFTASVEESANTYDDGEVMGSFLGLMDQDDNIKWMAPFDINIKAEGIAISETQTEVEVFITTDPDDPHKASILYRLLIPKTDL